MSVYVGLDPGGFFNYATGDQVELAYDEGSGEYYNALTGETVQLLGDAIKAAENTIIGVFGRQGYPARYPQQQTRYPQQQTQYPTGERQYSSQSASPASFNGQGIQLKWYTLLAIGAALALVATGKRLR